MMMTVVAAVLAQACSDSFGEEPEAPVSDCFNLSVSVPLASSRAESDGLNEFKVRGLHLYFFRTEGHDDITSEFVHDVVVAGEFDYSRNVRLELPADALAAGGLFGPSSETCLVYAVANVDENVLVGKTVSALQRMIVDSEFDETKVQDDFAMDGMATLVLDRSTRTVTGIITLQRAAAKLTLAVDLPDSIDVEQRTVNPIDGTIQIDTITYHSRPAEMHVWISNAVKRAELNTDPKVADEENLYSNRIYAAQGIGSSFTFDAAQAKYSYMQDVPFYSYPAKWDSYSPKGNCFMTLEIPWYYTDAAGVTHNIATYYRLSVQPGKNSIERNTHYDMRATIGRLGGTTVLQPVDMLFDWNYSMQWNIQTLPTDIKEIRYLLLNNNDFSAALDAYTFTMENETTISIPYNTSHPVEIESVELAWRDYYNNADRKITLSPTSGYRYTDVAAYQPMTHYAGISIDAVNSTLTVKRDMLHIAWENSRPVIKDEAAINAYNLKINLRHIGAETGDPSEHAAVIVTQIPAIYISTDLTPSGTRFVNNGNTSYGNRTPYKGYVGSSANRNDRQQLFWLGSVHNETQYVKNKHTYVLTISKFDADDNYIIADPRMRTVDNLNPSGTSASADASWTVNDGTRRPMRYYYPADRSDDKTRFVAPQIRVASQWGVTYQITRTGAERRCASYQEDGRPAGRWRLPTAAEIEYICRLSSRRYIPYLFGQENETANYWCASGGVDVDNKNVSVDVVVNDTRTTRAVRCVYDEWFWKTDTLTTKTAFRWGDRQRTTTGN